MSKSNLWENGVIALLFNGTSLANIADDAGSSPLTDLYISLHTADPGEAGNQTTNESAYGAYQRVAVSRDGTGWTVTGNAAVNAALIQFAECVSGNETITHFGIGTDAAAAGRLLYAGNLTTSLNVSAGIQPQFNPGDMTVTEE